MKLSSSQAGGWMARRTDDLLCGRNRQTVEGQMGPEREEVVGLGSNRERGKVVVVVVVVVERAGIYRRRAEGKDGIYITFFGTLY